MILVGVIGAWLGVVAIAVGIDVGTSYLAERPKTVKKVKSRRFEVEAIKNRITANRNLKKIEHGLKIMAVREVRVDRPRGVHRRLQQAI